MKTYKVYTDVFAVSVGTVKANSPEEAVELIREDGPTVTWDKPFPVGPRYQKEWPVYEGKTVHSVMTEKIDA